MTMNGAVIPTMAMFIVAAEEQVKPLSLLIVNTHIILFLFFIIMSLHFMLFLSCLLSFRMLPFSIYFKNRYYFCHTSQA